MDTPMLQAVDLEIQQKRYIDKLISCCVPAQKKSLAQTLNENTHNTNEQECCFCVNNPCCSIFSRWWNVRYKWQQTMIHFVEQTLFHIIVIILVIIDCLLVISELILDFVLLRKMCDSKSTNGTEAHNKHELHKLELAIEILHYASLVLLGMFVVEVLAKMFLFGRHWWDIHERKMEWLDTVIVLASFIVDLVILFRSNVFAEISLLFISLRLWRVIRIINGVAQTIQSEEDIKKRHLVASYHKLILALLTLSEKKTAMISDLDNTLTPDNYNEQLQKFKLIDHSQHGILQQHAQISSLNTVVDLTNRLQDMIDRL